VSPDLVTYRYYFGRWRRQQDKNKIVPCPERNFVIIGPNDSKLGMHASGNDSRCSAQEPQLYLVLFLNYSPLIDFIEHFLSAA